VKFLLVVNHSETAASLDQRLNLAHPFCLIELGYFAKNGIQSQHGAFEVKAHCLVAEGREKSSDLTDLARVFGCT